VWTTRTFVTQFATIVASDLLQVLVVGLEGFLWLFCGRVVLILPRRSIIISLAFFGGWSGSALIPDESHLLSISLSYGRDLFTGRNLPVCLDIHSLSEVWMKGHKGIVCLRFLIGRIAQISLPEFQHIVDVPDSLSLLLT